MDNLSLIDQDLAERARVDGSGILPTRRRTWWPGVALIAGLTALAGVSGEWLWRSSHHVASPPAPPEVTVSLPLQQTVQATERFLGQFAAVDSVELRAQVGGTLTGIGFQDGQIVRKGDPGHVHKPGGFVHKADPYIAPLLAAEFTALERASVEAVVAKHPDEATLAADGLEHPSAIMMMYARDSLGAVARVEFGNPTLDGFGRYARVRETDNLVSVPRYVAAHLDRLLQLAGVRS